MSVSVITTVVGSHCTSCNRCECVIPKKIAIFFVGLCTLLCALELFFACHRPKCKFLEKSVRAGVNNLLTFLAFTLENNTSNKLKNTIN